MYLGVFLYACGIFPQWLVKVWCVCNLIFRKNHHTKMKVCVLLSRWLWWHLIIVLHRFRLLLWVLLLHIQLTFFLQKNFHTPSYSDMLHHRFVIVDILLYYPLFLTQGIDHSRMPKILVLSDFICLFVQIFA